MAEQPAAPVAETAPAAEPVVEAAPAQPQYDTPRRSVAFIGLRVPSLCQDRRFWAT